MANDRLGTPPFVSHLLELSNLSVAALNVIVGSDFLAFTQSLVKVCQPLMHFGGQGQVQ